MRRQSHSGRLIGWLLLAAAIATPTWAQTITVSPTSASVPVSSTRQLTAAANGAQTSAVTWSVNGVVGGNTTVGKISTAGLYTAPAVPPAGWDVTATATSTTNPASSASAILTVRNQIPWVTTLNPSTIPFGNFTLQVNGSRFVNGAQILWNGAPLPTVFNSSTLLTASGTASQAGTVSITIANPGPGAVSTPLTLKVVSGVTLSLSPTSASVMTGASTQFTAAVAGNANTAVVWKVNNKVGGDGTTGTIDATGLYTAPGTVPSSGSVVVSAVSVVDNTVSATAIVAIQDPLAIQNGRFLEQATFGPSPQLTAYLKQVGIPAWIEEQFQLGESPWPSLATATRSDAVDAFFGNAQNGADQLRQRVIYALSEVIVEAMNKNTNGNEIVPWLQVLSRNAFGNYRDLLYDITLDASMGHYLDLVNSGVGGGAANENYPREVMQLFSIGLYKLNLDGSTQTDSNNRPVLAYTQSDVVGLAQALTGWTYPSANGQAPAWANFAYYPGVMVPAASGHITGPKSFLGAALPANQPIRKDLNDAIDVLFNHSNVGPFVATRLIRFLVTSNPTPAYIARVATAFNGGTGSPRGDMKAVIRAILLDPEARDDNPPANFGRLKPPMQHLIGLCRALGLPMGQASGFAYLFYDMHEGILDANSVFGHYSPGYRIPKTNLVGPEFQIYSASDAVNRANLFWSRMANPWPIHPMLQTFATLASNPTNLVNAVDNALLFGRMLPNTRTAILNAMSAMPDDYARALTALYITSMSGEYLVQR